MKETLGASAYQGRWAISCSHLWRNSLGMFPTCSNMTAVHTSAERKAHRDMGGGVWCARPWLACTDSRSQPERKPSEGIRVETESNISVWIHKCASGQKSLPRRAEAVAQQGLWSRATTNWQGVDKRVGLLNCAGERADWLEWLANVEAGARSPAHPESKPVMIYVGKCSSMMFILTKN